MRNTQMWELSWSVGAQRRVLIARGGVLAEFSLIGLERQCSGDSTTTWTFRGVSKPNELRLRTVGACFIALALYILYESGSMLIRHVPPKRSIFGIVIAAISVIVMPLLARAKRRVARQIGSGAMHADSKQADFCSYLSATLLGGLLLNAMLGWWWMDPAAGLVMVRSSGRKASMDSGRDLLRSLRASIVWSAFRQGMCSVVGVYAQCAAR